MIQMATIAPLALTSETLPATGAEANAPEPDCRGPIVSKAMKTRLRDGGVEAPGYRFAPHQKTTPFRASWIWASEANPVSLFRREFDLGSVPSGVIAYLSADASYRLWVNGKLASRGPADIGMDYHRVPTGKWFYDVRDLAPLLKKGRNVLAVEVFSERLIGWEGTREHGGFLCEIEGLTIPVVTDASWKVIPAAYWKKHDGYWVFHGGEEPAGWRLSGFDDSVWQSATIISNRWQPIVASEVPPRMEAIYPPVGMERLSANIVKPGKKLFPVSVPSDGALSVRYERVLSAFVGVTIRGGGGGTLFIEPNEPNAPGFNRRAAIALTGVTQTVELPFMDSFSVINLRAEGIKSPLEILDVRANFCSLPVEYRGEFSCSDPELTRLWRVCRWATQICLQTHHLDSPHHQEPISDPGDYLIESLLNYSAFFQPWLTRQDLRKYAWIMGQCQNQVFHTSYSLLWLQMLLDYYDYTGDDTLVRELAPAVHSLLDTFTGYRGKNGLLSEAPNYMFMDWVDVAGFPGHHPPAVIGQGYMTAFYYHALANAIRVAELQKDNSRVTAYEKLRKETKTSFERELWVENKGQYRDGKPFQSSVKPGQWLPEDKDIETFTAHVNILAVLYDLAPKDRQASILEKAIAGPNFSCQPYFMHFVFDALAHCGLFERHARQQMARWKIVEETQSLREMWTVGDLSHAWGATPLYQMSARILGVRPAAPGFREIRIEPLVSGLDFAKGVVPAPQGLIRVEWRKSVDKFHLKVEIPSDSVAEVHLPGGRVERIRSGKHEFVS